MPPQPPPAQSRVTRLAPSPTGALHLGNARTFLINWALARKHGWHIVLRIEDLDGPRVKSDAAQQAIDILTWLGIDWDEGPHYQLHDLSAYEQALAKLDAAGLTYRCVCTRKDIVSAQSAPHADEHELRYPGTCRDRTATDLPYGVDTAVRVRVPDADVMVDDQVMGMQLINVQRTTGDFVVASKAGLPAYQLAVVVDDARQGVTDIVRGDDLLSSAARQIWLYRMLGITPLPTYWHLPLVLGEDGHRLAKRHGDTRVAMYREAGTTPERMIAMLARWSGVDAGDAMSAAQFAKAFDVSRLPREPAVFTQEDDRWLRTR
jgi:glutamyl-tRNA synthetase